MDRKERTIEYFPGIFDFFKTQDDLYLWDALDSKDDMNKFPNVMWGLGFEMDCCESFDKYYDSLKKSLQEPSSRRENFKNKLYALEHADISIVGNYLFSEWRYYTHWSYGYDEYDVNFLKRIIMILETKFLEIEEPV